GWIGRKHAEVVVANEQCELVGVCDVNNEHASFAIECSVPFSTDLDTLLTETQPDGAIIAVANGFHGDVAECCARHGVHVLIEKPVSDTLSEAQRIITAADAAGIHVLVGHHRRHSPLIQDARAVVRYGNLGKLLGVSMLWALYKPRDYFDVDWRSKRPGGGPTFINLIHELDSLRFICGEITRVYAIGSSEARGLEVEDTLSITLSFESGAVGSILASDASPAPWSYEATTAENPHYFHADENCYHFLGTEGSLAFPRMELWSYANSERGWQHPLKKHTFDIVLADPIAIQLQHFCEVIRNETPPLVDARDGARTLAVALAVIDSIESRQPVDVGEIQ
ncbi:MAG: Gfo/Idh/MocA family oxidoreductase, partial [Lentisphaeria bacterium]|nr:Gfo/Idh/MocA family oxidoreductase [Lentisphaeria bacterium]NQZ69208.1 Gfo/Idh/MocA family oxidoreductase [Lentisphaeria bacterium]